MLKEYECEICSVESKIFHLYHDGKNILSQRLYGDDIPKYIEYLEKNGFVKKGIHPFTDDEIKNFLTSYKKVDKEGMTLLGDVYKNIPDVDTKNEIKIQAYNKFAELMLELYDGDIADEMNCPVSIIRQNIKDIRDQLIKEAGEE